MRFRRGVRCGNRPGVDSESPRFVAEAPSHYQLYEGGDPS